MSTSELSEPGAGVRPGKRRTGGVFVALVPWVLFSVITQHDTLEAAAIAALVASALIAAPSVLAQRAKLLELGAVVAFFGFTVASLVADPSATHTLERYARAITALMLALIAFISLRFVPFTEQYARESVPREFWTSPRFRQINQQLTRMWGLVFLVMTVSHTIAGAIDTRRANTIFNWVVPVVAAAWAARRTGQVSARETG